MWAIFIETEDSERIQVAAMPFKIIQGHLRPSLFGSSVFDGP